MNTKLILRFGLGGKPEHGCQGMAKHHRFALTSFPMCCNDVISNVVLPGIGLTSFQCCFATSFQCCFALMLH